MLKRNKINETNKFTASFTELKSYHQNNIYHHDIVCKTFTYYQEQISVYYKLCYDFVPKSVTGYVNTLKEGTD